MRIATTLLQLLIAFVLTATFMPIVLVAVPATRNSTTGPVVGAGMLVLLFAVLWMVWPRRRR